MGTDREVVHLLGSGKLLLKPFFKKIRMRLQSHFLIDIYVISQE